MTGSVQAAFLAALGEVYRLVIEGAPPNGTAPEQFGAYAPVVAALHTAYQDEAGDAATIGALMEKDTLGAVRRTWDVWRRLPEYRPLAIALQQAAAGPEDNRNDLAWLIAQLDLLPRTEEPMALRTLLKPTIDRLVAMDDDPTVVAALEIMRRHFSWTAETFKAYKAIVARARRTRQKEQRPEIADAPAEDDEELGPTVPPPIFLSPAQAFYGGVVYVSHKIACRTTRHDKRRGAVTTTTYKSVIINSMRDRMRVKPPPPGADPDSVWWLDEGRRLALLGGLIDAPENRWSYDGMVAWLNGADEPITAHEVYDQLMASLRTAVHHDDEESYVVDVLWTIGTYFYRMFPAYPYLAIHGEKGSGKTTLLNWLAEVCFNAEFVVNMSEAALFRSIQAKSPTLLIDEQEGLNTSKDAKLRFPELLGILKSGYKLGAKVMRQRTDRPEITEYFDVYSPKALAAIEMFEEVLANRTIPTFMYPQPAPAPGTSQDTPGDALPSYRGLRDSLYILMMTHAGSVARLLHQVQVERANRYRELLLPLYVMAELVDESRGDTTTATREAMDRAAERKAELRKRRDQLSTEEILKETLKQLCNDANDDPSDFDHGTVQDDGWVLVDTIQIKHAYERMFSSTDQSFYNDIWLGRAMLKLRGVKQPQPRRRWRIFKTIDGTTFTEKTDRKSVSCYLLDPAAFRAG